MFAKASLSGPKLVVPPYSVLPTLQPSCHASQSRLHCRTRLPGLIHAPADRSFSRLDAGEAEVQI